MTRVWPPCGDASPEAFIDLTGPSSDLELARELEAMLRGEGWTVTSPVRETGDVLFAAESGETRAVIEDYKPVMALELSIDEACSVGPPRSGPQRSEDTRSGGA